MGNETELDKLDTEEVTPPVASDTAVVGDADKLPAADDKVPAVIGDAEVDDGGVRTNSAVEPIADTLATGAGAPHPPPSNVDAEGRETFPDGVAPTAEAGYDGPGAPPAGQNGGEAAEETEEGSSSEESNPVPEDVSDAEPDVLAEEHSAEELKAAAEARDLPTSGTKAEVAERIVAYDRDEA